MQRQKPVRTMEDYEFDELEVMIALGITGNKIKNINVSGGKVNIQTVRGNNDE